MKTSQIFLFIGVGIDFILAFLVFWFMKSGEKVTQEKRIKRNKLVFGLCFLAILSLSIQSILYALNK